MKTTSTKTELLGHTIESRLGEDGLYHAFIDGEQAADIKASSYRRVVLKWAVEVYREKFLIELQTVKGETMNTKERIEELQEKFQEFILNESVFADDHPSWGEVAEAQAEAERKWDETDEGKELKALSAPLKIKPNPDCKACHGTGEVMDWVDYGATEVSMPSLCDCVLEQIPEGEEDREVEIVHEEIS